VDSENPPEGWLIFGGHIAQCGSSGGTQRMNIRLGLERISAVWWGFWGLLGAIAVGAAVVSASNNTAGIFWTGLGGMVAAYLLHRLTCWVIGGFFPARS
jgi:hypothetical protein